MNISSAPIIPITQARSSLGNLAEQVSQDQYIILTKGGVAKAALVDLAYLTKLQNDLKKLYQITYINPDLLPFTREFSDDEIEEWQREDQLP